MDAVKALTPIQENFIDFSNGARREIEAYLRAIDNIELEEAGALEQVSPSERDLPTFRREIMTAHAIAREEGFVVLPAIPGLSFEHRFAIGWVAATVIGTPLVQKEDTQARNVMLYDRDGASMKDGARYHQSKDGGSNHRDNVNKPTPWRTMILSCVQPAAQGGESIFVNAHDIHDHLRANNPEVLNTLSQDFWFDGRGFDVMFKRPTFSEGEHGLKVRYLRDYIEAGYQKCGEALTRAQIVAIDVLDAAA